MEAAEFASDVWLERSLDVTAHYVRRIRDHASYGDAALRLAAEIADLGMQSDEVGTRTAALKAMDLWRAAQSELRPEGVPVGAWDRWSTWLEWARAEAAAEAVDPAFAAAAAALDRSLAASPVRFRPERRWLEQSDLSNQAFWPAHGLPDILPAPLLREGKVNGVVARQMGTSRWRHRRASRSCAGGSGNGSRSMPGKGISILPRSQATSARRISLRTSPRTTPGLCGWRVVRG